MVVANFLKFVMSRLNANLL